MDIAVTGGSGFIGGHIAESLAADGHSIVVLDNMDPFYDTGIKQHTLDRVRTAAQQSAGSCEFVQGDVRDGEVVSRVVSDCDVVFHQAAQAGVRTSVENPRKPNSINIDGTLNVLDAARESATKRIVIASSSSVYGKPEYLPYDEGHPTTPVSPYGVSKLAAEQYGRVYSEVYDLPVVSLRYFTVYGSRMRPNMAISNFVSRCMNGEPPVVYGNGSQTRDFTYIDDVIRANEVLLDTDVADGQIINIGSTDTIDIQSLAEEVRDQLAPDLPIEYTERREADAEHTHADVSKAQELLGYEPTVSIRQGVQLFINWYRKNRDWYEPLVRAE